MIAAPPVGVAIAISHERYGSCRAKCVQRMEQLLGARGRGIFNQKLQKECKREVIEGNYNNQLLLAQHNWKEWMQQNFVLLTKLTWLIMVIVIKMKHNLGNN